MSAERERRRVGRVHWRESGAAELRDAASFPRFIKFW